MSDMSITAIDRLRHIRSNPLRSSDLKNVTSTIRMIERDPTDIAKGQDSKSLRSPVVQLPVDKIENNNMNTAQTTSESTIVSIPSNLNSFELSGGYNQSGLIKALDFVTDTKSYGNSANEGADNLSKISNKSNNIDHFRSNIPTNDSDEYDNSHSTAVSQIAAAMYKKISSLF